MKKLLAYKALLFTALAMPLEVEASGNVDDFDALSLESLGEIVTSVSKKPEDSFRSAAAIHVITNEQIKLSGATHIAEVLRGVPGLNVAQIDASNWAITSRGFNGLFSNKLLVLMDGRTIYTPIFSGVYWDAQNVVLDDIERIEVIRGPGASLWGANAVNGIINIISKNSADTQGAYASTLVGNQQRNITDLRYGGKVGDDAYYRVYGKYEKHNSTPTIQNTNGNNQWDNAKSGFRSDWQVNPDRKVTLQGDFADGDINLDISTPSFSDASGYYSRHEIIRSRWFDVLGRWEEKHNADMTSTFQAYVDYQGRDYSSLGRDIYTFDTDYQTSYDTSDRNNLLWGGGARIIKSGLTGSFDINLANDVNTSHIYGVFVQDKYALSPNELYLTVGSKLEHNNFSGFEVEPSARLAWYPTNTQTLWTGVSRAVRMPSYYETVPELNGFTAAPGLIVQQAYNKNFKSEELVAYELGYRIEPIPTLSIDTTAFLNNYNNLATLEPRAIRSTALGAFLPYQVSNLGKATTHGFEASVDWDVASRWNLLGSYSYLKMDLDKGASQDPTFLGQEGEAPQNQFSLRSQLFLPRDVQLVNAAYYVDELSSVGVKDYVRFDTQVMWQPTAGLEFALVGQNLLDNKHQEFDAPLGGVANEIPRTFYGRVTLRY